MDRKELIQRTIRFYNRYGSEINSIKQLLEIRLKQLALAYTLENNLPLEAVQVISRVKKMNSFLKKLEKKGWPEFYYPTEVVNDLIGARVTCWFLDDCYSFLDYIKQSKHFEIINDSIKDYIKNPKKTGYRSIHLLSNVYYDRVKSVNSQRKIVNDKMLCEIQIRTKLQDSWGEFTHEVHYKIPGEFESDYETLVCEIANRLASEDRTFIAVRNILLKTTDKKEREGFYIPDKKNDKEKKPS